MMLSTVGLLLTLSLAGCNGSSSTGAPGSSAAAPSSPGSSASGATIASVEAVEGNASVLHGSQRIVAAPGLALAARDRLETEAGKMRVRMRDGSVLAIGAGTKLSLADLVMDESSRSGRIDVVLGRFWMNVTKWTGKGESRYEVATPNAVAGVRGTTLWGDTDVDAICALEGTIEVRSRKDARVEPATLSDGHCASKLSEGQLEPLTPSPEQIEKYLDEVLIRTK